jgi:hypothetical protein
MAAAAAAPCCYCSCRCRQPHQALKLFAVLLKALQDLPSSGARSAGGSSSSGQQPVSDPQQAGAASHGGLLDCMGSPLGELGGLRGPSWSSHQQCIEVRSLLSPVVSRIYLHSLFYMQVRHLGSC